MDTTVQQGRRAARVALSARLAVTLLLALGLLTTGSAAGATKREAAGVQQTKVRAVVKEDKHLLTSRKTKPVTASPAAIGPAFFVSVKKIKKKLLSAQQADSASRSSLVASLSISKTRSGKNAYQHRETKRFFQSSLYAGRTHKGAVPGTIAVVQTGARNWAKAELAAYKADKKPTGGKNYGVTSTSVTHVYRSNGQWLSQTAMTTGSAVIVTVCHRDGGHEATTKQLNRCSQGLASLQRHQAAKLFERAPVDFPWLNNQNSTQRWTPTVGTDTSAGCAITQPADPSTAWCGVDIIPGSASSVGYDQITDLSATYGKVSQGSENGVPTILYVPPHDGVYTDTISYRLRNTAYGLVSGAGSITLTINANGNYTLAAANGGDSFTPQAYDAVNLTCTEAAPPNPGGWCRYPVSLNALGVVSGSSGISYDQVTPTSTQGLGSVAAEFSGGQWYIYYKPLSNGYFTDQITFQVGNTRLGVVSNAATISITVLHNGSYL